MNTIDAVKQSYAEWPDARKEEIGREILGEHLVAVYNSWVGTARHMLYDGFRYKSPTQQQEAYFEWMATLPLQDRSSVMTFISQMIDGVLFSVLNTFDGNSGFVLRGGYCERLKISLEVSRRDTEGLCLDTDPLENISLNSEEDIQLHASWHEWRDKYGKPEADIAF